MPELVYIIAWFVLPLIPAFLLFKYLPSTGSVGSSARKKKDNKASASTEENSISGPFKGMAIKFGGAFAGYLVLFWLSKDVLKDGMKKPAAPVDLTETWTIKGEVQAEDNKYDKWDEAPGVKIDPLPPKQSFTRSSFDVEVLAVNDGKGYLDFPSLDFTTNTYKAEPLPNLDFSKPAYNIDSNYVITDKKSRIITLKKPLRLHLKTSVIPVGPGEEITVDTSRFN